MKRKEGLLQWLVVVLAALMGACSADDAQPEEKTVTPRVQVMAVFAPGQLGDQGYADRVMKGVNTLKKMDTNADGVEVNFIASYDVETTCTMLADWAGSSTSLIDGTPYNRRLVVLTEPFMVKWLAEVKDRMTDSDEVLLLKVNDDDVEAAAQMLCMERNRVHGLNISAASAVRHFEETRRDYYEMTGRKDVSSIGVMRLYDEGVMTYRDSINETLSEMNPGQELSPLSIIDVDGEVYNTEYEATAFQMTYVLTNLIWGVVNMVETRFFCIADLGAAGSGAEFFLMGKNDNMRVVMLMLDGEPNGTFQRFSIKRYWDRALAGWMQRWLRQPATMPLMESHGGWDGYCTDDIDLLSIVF